MKNMKKSLLPLAGATLMLGSVIAITEAAVSKKKSRGASAVQTLAGIAGLVSGVVLALQPLGEQAGDRKHDYDTAARTEQSVCAACRKARKQESERASGGYGYLLHRFSPL